MKGVICIFKRLMRVSSIKKARNLNSCSAATVCITILKYPYFPSFLLLMYYRCLGTYIFRSFIGILRSENREN